MAKRVFRSDYIFFILSFLLLLERFLSFLLYQAFHFTLPSMYFYIPLSFLIVKYFGGKLIPILIGISYLSTILFYYYLHGGLMNPGETFSFYSFILGLFLINPQKMMENSSHPVTLKQLKIASIVFVLCYFFTAMWGEYYFVTNINAHKNMILGFIWPHGFGYFTALLGMILVANGAPFFALMIMFCGLLVGSRTAFLVTLLGIIYLIIYILRFVDEPSNFKKRVAFRGLLILIMSMGSFGIFFFVWVHYDDIFFLQRMVLTFSLIEFDVDFSSPAWVELTSGRSIFWSQITEYFFEKNRISGSWIWGLSPEIIRILNKNSFGLSIWMHNDWLQALYAFGFLGFIFYVVGIIRFITRLNFSFFALSFVLFTSILNGLYPYMGISILYLLAFYQAKLENKTCDE